MDSCHFSQTHKKQGRSFCCKSTHHPIRNAVKKTSETTGLLSSSKLWSKPQDPSIPMVFVAWGFWCALTPSKTSTKRSRLFRIVPPTSNFCNFGEIFDTRWISSWKNPLLSWATFRWEKVEPLRLQYLVAGFNPFQNDSSNSIISPGRGENNKIFETSN